MDSESEVDVTLTQKSEAITEHLPLIQQALQGFRGTDQQRIAEVGVQWLTILLQKNADYGSSVWKTPVLGPHLSAGDAILVRASDKIQRLQSLMEKQTGPEVASESIADTMGDLGAYMLLYLARPREEESATPTDNGAGAPSIAAAVEG